MTRTGLFVGIVWALLLCAPLDVGYADAESSTDANAPLGSPGKDARLTLLAQKLASPDAAKQDGTGSPSTQHLAAGTQRPGGTPRVSHTPLIRPGSAFNQSDAPTGSGPSIGLLKTLTALGVVIGLALLARFGYARLGGKVAIASSPVVEVLSRTSVAPRSHVMLLRVGGRVLVVSDSSAGMRTLASVEDAQEVADLLGAVSAAKPTSISRGFSKLFQRFDEDHDRLQGASDHGDAQRPSPERVRESVTGLLARVRSLGRREGAR